MYVSGGYSDADFEKMKVMVGLELLQPTDVGVFHYEQSNRDTAACAVLSNHGTRVSSLSSWSPKAITYCVNTPSRVLFICVCLPASVSLKRLFELRPYIKFSIRVTMAVA